MAYRTNNTLDLYNDPRLIPAVENWDLINFFDTHNVDYKLDGKNIGTDFIGVSPCPDCGDSRYHFGVHKTKKYGTCFICKGYAGPLRLVSFFKKISFIDAFDHLLELNHTEKDTVDEVKDIINSAPKKRKLLKPQIIKDPLPKDAIKITNKMIKRNKKLSTFLAKRGVSILDVYSYKLYWENGFIIWPIYLDGQIVAHQKRSIHRKQYLTSTHLGSYLFEQDKIKPGKPLILVEGFFDFLNVKKFILKYHPTKYSITTGMVKSISAEQIQRMVDCKPSEIIVMFDNDSWFDYAKVDHKMPMNVSVIHLPKGKDPAELTKKELQKIFKRL